MIVKERNFDSDLRKIFKDLIIRDLFDKVGIALSTKRASKEEITEEFIENLSSKVDNFFYTLVASDTPIMHLLPKRLKDARDFYIFAVHVVPTGGILISFIALLSDSVEPVELQLIY